MPDPFSASSHPARWWHREGRRVVCDLCPRGCRLLSGHRGRCKGRRNRSGAMALVEPATRGARLEPIEATLLHFHPGATFLRAGAEGSFVTPERIAEQARELGCRGVIFAGDGPAIVPELAIETALACRRRGLATVAATDGAIAPGARAELFSVMDAAAVTLRRCDDRSAGRPGPSHVGPVLEGLLWLVKDARVWLEVRTPLVPGWNDHPEDVRALARWVHEALGPAVPLHFDAAPSGAPATTPAHAREIARRVGLRHVYAADAPGGRTTTCAGCGHPLIEREALVVSACRLTPDGRCPACGARLAGRFDGVTRSGRATWEAA